MAQAKKKIVKGEALVNAVDSAISVLSSIADNTAQSLVIVDKDNKKFSKEAKRLSKKKAVLAKKKKNASAKAKKSPIADNKKALKAIEKELNSIIKDAAKILALKTATLDELNTLKSVAKRTTAYNKSLVAIDKVLNKPKAKKKKAKKPAMASNVSSIGSKAA